MRSSDQGRNQSYDSGFTRRGVQISRSAEDMSQVRAPLDRRGVVGKGLLTGLRCEEVPLDNIARAVGTPCYVYSSAAVRQQYKLLRDATAKIDARLHYSVKANSSIAIL